MVCTRVRTIMHSLTLVHYRYVHVHNHNQSSTPFPQHRMISVVILFRNFEIIFCFVVAICDLVYDVETIIHLSYVLKALGNLF